MRVASVQLCSLEETLLLMSRWRTIAACQFAKRRPSKFYGSFSGSFTPLTPSAYGPDAFTFPAGLFING